MSLPLSITTMPSHVCERSHKENKIIQCRLITSFFQQNSCTSFVAKPKRLYKSVSELISWHQFCHNLSIRCNSLFVSEQTTKVLANQQKWISSQCSHVFYCSHRSHWLRVVAISTTQCGKLIHTVTNTVVATLTSIAINIIHMIIIIMTITDMDITSELL